MRIRVRESMQVSKQLYDYEKYQKKKENKNQKW